MLNRVLVVGLIIIFSTTFFQIISLRLGIVLPSVVLGIIFVVNLTTVIVMEIELVRERWKRLKSQLRKDENKNTKKKKETVKKSLCEILEEKVPPLPSKLKENIEVISQKEICNLEIKKEPEKLKKEHKKVSFINISELDEHDEIDMNFEYTEIDEDSLRIIEQLGVEERKDFQFKKWCINQKKQLAFVHLLYVSPAILRCDGNDCLESYLVVCRDEYFVMEIYYPDFHVEYADYKKIKIQDDICKVNISNEQLSNALIEAIKTYHEGRKIDYQKERELAKKESLRKTPNKIMQGAFSPLMQKMIDGVNEVSRIEYVFRKLCLKHFTEYNVAVQGYNRFYLHDDEDSFLLFDVILWMYLHLGNSMEQLKIDWVSVINEQYLYRNAFSGDFLKHFCIGGDKRFFFEKYLANRIAEGKIVIYNDQISFSGDYSEQIISYLEKEKASFINSELLINDTIEEKKNNQNAEKEGLHFILLKEWQVDHMIMGAFKPEPSGYGAMPPEQLNVVYGVADKEERFILTKYREVKSDTFKGGYKSYYVIWYKKTVDSRDEIRELTVSCEMNKKREKFFDLQSYWNLWGDFEEYRNKIMLAIRYYERSDELKRIEEEIHQGYSKSLQAYREERHREITEKYKKKWK